MDHKAWLVRMREIMRAEKTDRKKALRLAVKFEEECRALAEKDLTRWQAREALGYVGSLHDDLGNHKRAAEIFERLARIELGQMTSSGRSAAQNLAEAALFRFELGQNEAAVELTKESLRLLGRYPEPNVIVEKAI